jgi:tRNA G18 (ribose-2'-O)-methylase SpoU
MSNIIKINDLSIPELDVYARLSEVQLLRYHEPDLGLFICESTKVIMRALDAGYMPVSILVEEKEINDEVSEIIERCDDLCKDIPIYTANHETLSQLTGFNLTRGMLCCMKRNALPSVEEIVVNARRIAVMEDVVNPTNVGAIFRSAAALNMDAILLTPACSNPLYRRAARVSMGTVFQAPWTFFKQGPSDDPNQSYVTELKNHGFKTVAFALRDDSISIDDPRLAAEEKLAIILGTEGEGLQDSTLHACDYTVKIPMSHGVDSLNVAAASAIAFWELGK